MAKGTRKKEAEPDKQDKAPKPGSDGDDEESEEESDDSEPATPSDEEAVGTDLEEFLQRKQRGASAARTEDPDEEEALLEAMEEREGRGAETLTVKVVPEQPNEFTCQRCFLVKHRSQLKDRKRSLCADCA